jgi:hypothetical protein
VVAFDRAPYQRYPLGAPRMLEPRAGTPAGTPKGVCHVRLRREWLWFAEEWCPEAGTFVALCQTGAGYPESMFHARYAALQRRYSADYTALVTAAHPWTGAARP